MNKLPEDAWALIEEMESNAYQWSSKFTTRKVTDIHNVNIVMTLATKM